MTENQMAGAGRNVAGKVEDAAGGLTGDAKTQARGKIDQVAGKAQEAYGDAADAVSSAAKDTGATLSDMAQRVSSTASDVGGQVYAQGAQAAKYVSDQLRSEPLAAMVAIGALGVLIGYLIGRPSQDEKSIDVGPYRASYRRR